MSSRTSTTTSSSALRRLSKKAPTRASSKKKSARDSYDPDPDYKFTEKGYKGEFEDLDDELDKLLP